MRFASKTPAAAGASLITGRPPGKRDGPAAGLRPHLQCEVGGRRNLTLWTRIARAIGLPADKSELHAPGKCRDSREDDGERGSGDFEFFGDPRGWGVAEV